MEPISNADRIMAILRQRLREKTAAQPGKVRGRSGQEGLQAPVGGLAALAELKGATPAQLRHACIQALLSDQLGEGLLNEAQFQQVVSQVVAALSEDAAAARLLDRVIGDLKSAK